MIGFWIAASLMIAAGLAFLLPPLIGRVKHTDTSRDAVNLAIYRDRRQELEAQHAAGGLDDESLAATLAELDRDLLRDVDGDDADEAGTANRSPWSAIVVAVALPMVALGLYLQLGTPTALFDDAGAMAGGGARSGAPPAGSADGNEPPHSVEEMVAALARRLESNPDDPQGWLMLGRSYAAMNRLADARAALEEANRRRPDHPMTLVTLAEVIAGQQGNRLDGEPAALVERALELQPDFARALWLAGVHAFNQNDPARAAALWQRILALPGLSPEVAAQVRDAIAQAGGTPDGAPAAGGIPDSAPAGGIPDSAPAGARPDAAPAGARPDSAPAQAARTGSGEAAAGDERAADERASVTVNVSLGAGLSSRVSGNETLFVFARAASGPRMPLAIARLSASQLPARVTLDESMAMAPQMTLATFPQVVVGARISRTGNAAPASGDLEGSSAPVAPAGGAEVNITIDRIVQ